MGKRWDLDDLVGVSDLAAFYNTSYATISNWPKRYADFPAPLTQVGNRPVYSFVQVEAWVKAKWG